MSDLVGNPEDRFSRVTAQISVKAKYIIVVTILTAKPRCHGGYVLSLDAKNDGSFPFGAAKCN